jgi:uncharacterized protein YpmS
MDWNFIMNTALATVIASIIALAGVFITHWFDDKNGYKNVDAKIGQLENITLSGQHQNIENLIEQKVGKLDNQSLAGLIEQKAGRLDNTTLSGQNIAILKAIQDFQNKIEYEKKVAGLKRGQLTGDQAKINQSITALEAFAHIMTDLQNENVSLKAENQNLRHEIDLIQQQNPDRDQAQDIDFDLS